MTALQIFAKCKHNLHPFLNKKSPGLVRPRLFFMSFQAFLSVSLLRELAEHASIVLDVSRIIQNRADR